MTTLVLTVSGKGGKGLRTDDYLIRYYWLLEKGHGSGSGTLLWSSLPRTTGKKKKRGKERSNKNL